MELNEYQKTIRNFKEGRCGVLASSGAGKTASIVERTAELIKQGVNPKSILIISFSKKIVEEMSERLFKKLGEIANDIEVKTFHALGYRMLAANGIKCDLIKPYEIENFFKDKYKNIVVSEVMGLIGYQKNHGLSYNDNLLIDRGHINKYDLKRYFKEYEDFKTKLNKIDYDDMLVKAVHLLETNKEVKDWYNNRYEYVMVDEYQDTNTIQDKMLDLITEKHGNLMCLFDYKQAIYAFRGSSSEYALGFKGDIIHLPINYRSTQNIVDMSNKFIKSYYEQYKHHIDSISNKKHDGKIVINNFDMIKEIKELIDNGTNPKDIAILYRNNFLSCMYETALRKEQIPYVVKNAYSYYDRFEIKVLINYLRLIENKYNNDAFVEIINVPSRFLGKEFINKLLGEQSYYLSMSKLVGEWRYAKGINEFKSVIGRCNKDENCGSTLDKVVRAIRFKDFIKEKYYDSDDGFDDRIKNVESLIELCRGFDNISKFLNFIDSSTKNDGDCVQLMTIHKSKGLEFKNVFLMNVDENILPSNRCINEIEEANLFYVGITRAIDNLYVQGNSMYIDKLIEMGY